MSDFLSVFSIFDIFTSLIPGMIFLTLFGILLPTDILNLWKDLPHDKYVVFFIMCYLVGLMMNNTFYCLMWIRKKFYDFNRVYYKSKWLLKDKDTIDLAEELIKEITKNKEKMNETNEEEKAAFAIKYMLIQLNMNDKNNRKDRLSALADMHGIMAFGFLILSLVQCFQCYRNAKSPILDYRWRIILLIFFFVVSLYRSLDFQHHKYVQTILSYDILRKQCRDMGSDKVASDTHDELENSGDVSASAQNPNTSQDPNPPQVEEMTLS